jgi:hypothetical protein
MCWMDWEQSKMPFSSKILKYIEKIDILEDMKNLCQNIKLRDKCFKNYRITNLVLKTGAMLGLTLNEIGNLIYREGFDETPSPVETLVEKANKINNLFVKSNISLK